MSLSSAGSARRPTLLARRPVAALAACGSTGRAPGAMTSCAQNRVLAALGDARFRVLDATFPADAGPDALAPAVARELVEGACADVRRVGRGLLVLSDRGVGSRSRGDPVAAGDLRRAPRG